jgi:uncharacterized coiled-coil protein SlyX
MAWSPLVDGMVLSAILSSGCATVRDLCSAPWRPSRELKDWVIHHTQSTQAELHELREQVSTQKAQMEELSSQLQDLRALVSSQQQVLMYMGKDMEMAPPAELELSLVPHASVTLSRP